DAVAAEAAALPAPQSLNLTRDQLARQGRVPSQLALFFSMAERTTKNLEAPSDAGWYVVHLDDIEAPEVAADDPIVAGTIHQLGQIAANEYVAQLVDAAQRERGAVRNPAAIDAVAAQLTGQTGN